MQYLRNASPRKLMWIRAHISCKTSFFTRPISPKYGEYKHLTFVSIMTSYFARKSSPSIPDKPHSWATTIVVQNFINALIKISLAFDRKQVSISCLQHSLYICKCRVWFQTPARLSINQEIIISLTNTCFDKPTTFWKTVQTCWKILFCPIFYVGFIKNCPFKCSLSF